MRCVSSVVEGTAVSTLTSGPGAGSGAQLFARQFAVELWPARFQLVVRVCALIREGGSLESGHRHFVPNLLELRRRQHPAIGTEDQCRSGMVRFSWSFG